MEPVIAVEQHRLRGVGLGLTGTGAVAQLVGLALDAWLHARDPGLAARESVLSLDNAGHALLLAGLALVMTGVTVTIVTSRFHRRPSGRRRTLEAAAIIAAAVVLSATTAAAASRMAEHEEGLGHSKSSESTMAANGPRHDTTTGHASGHGSGPSLAALQPAERAELDAQLATAAAIAARFPSIEDARRAGYDLSLPYAPLIGSHYIRFEEIDGTFDVARPEMLLFDGDAPTSRIVGLTYYVLASTAPAGFTGPADVWHRHENTCITPEGPVFAGDGYRRCKSSGQNSWMLHAWVVPGSESPHGVFSAENIRLG